MIFLVIHLRDDPDSLGVIYLLLYPEYVFLLETRPDDWVGIDLHTRYVRGEGIDTRGRMGHRVYWTLRTPTKQSVEMTLECLQ